MVDRVLIGADFSEAGNAAIHWVCQHFLPGAAVRMVHVLPREPRPSFATGPAPSDAAIHESAAATAAGELARLARQFCPAAETQVRHGRPADELAAAAPDCNLIVVGEHRQAHGPLNVLGSTAEQLVRCGPVPVLLARGLPAATPRNVLAAIDDSPLAPRVLCWADRMAKQFSARAAVCYALPRIYAHLRIVSSPAASQRVDQAMLAQAGRWLQQQVERHAPEGRVTTLPVTEGDPAQEILRAAREEGADLIVLGSRGAGALNRAVVGSVAQSVLRGAACSVLVVSRQTRD